jgi:hypothetical protein
LSNSQALTERERDVLEHAAAGNSNTENAAAPYLSILRAAAGLTRRATLELIARESGVTGLRGRLVSRRPQEPDPGHAGEGSRR